MNNLFNDIIQTYRDLIIQQDNSILVEDIENIYYNLDLLYEDNKVLKCPTILFEKIKNEVQSTIKLGKSSSKKVFIHEIIGDKYLTQFDDQKLYSSLVELFKNRTDAYVTLDVRFIDDGPILTFSGSFQQPIKFQHNRFRDSTLHLAMPKIKPLIITDNKIINQFKKKYQNEIKKLKSMYQRDQIALKNFKQNIMNFQNFGTITIYPDNCESEISLDEAIQHECQHFYIFLLELAKTCIYFGRHFSNAIRDRQIYHLRQDEFITLVGTYSNQLKRIYQKIEGEKSLNDFVHAVIQLAIFEHTDKDQKYTNALRSSIQWTQISNFFKLIWKDSNNGIKTKMPDNSIKQIVNFGNNHKFQKLIKWTIKNLEENLKMN